MMKRTFFTLLVKMNKVIFPGYYKADLNNLTAFQKAVTAFRYWALTNSLK
ncbi:hypothetical protein ACSBL2_18210 [Pedobacter sp. AW31-3R]